ncbi:helix-turn-helix transcriptional regulator [Plantactinospora sp. DSM 117369]
MQTTIGEHLARIRRRAELTQEQLAEASSVSVETIRALEQGKRASARMATLARLARALGVPTSALLGSAARAAALREPGARPLGLVEIRRALTPVRGLDGQPVDDQAERRPPSAAGLLASIRETGRLYHANDYAAMLTVLPGLLGEAGALVASTDGEAQAEAYGLHAYAHGLAGRLMMQLRQSDLAHVALAAAVDSAAQSGDRVIGATVVRSLCRLLLRQGRVVEAERLAVRTADAVEPRMSRARPEELAVWGDLLVSAAAAAVRDNRDDDAREQLDLAESAAVRLRGRHHDLLNVACTDLSVASVAMMRVEVAAVAGQPDRALSLSTGMQPSPIVAPSSYQRHRLDVASAYVQTGRYGDATDVLVDLRDRAPAWLRHQRYARDIVTDLAVARRRAMTKELAELADLVGC